MLDHIRIAPSEPAPRAAHHRKPTPKPAHPMTPVGPQADHDQGWQRERRQDREDCSEQADGNKHGLCP